MVARFVRPLLGNWSRFVLWRKAHLHIVVRIEWVGRPLEAAGLASGGPRGTKFSIGNELGEAVQEIQAAEV